MDKIKKKMGRPTENPKSKPIHIRLYSEYEDILDRYQEKFNITRAESVRIGIKKLKEDL